MNKHDITLDSPPLVNLDEACYMATRSQYVPRAQWTDLAKLHPNKTLTLPNLQLVQSLVGRGVYSHPLEWWYEVFSHSDASIEDRIHVVCTEDMANIPETTMESITSFLGLPAFDFENVTDVGRYNVGGHRGYDTITKSHEEDDEEDITKVESTDDEESSNVKPEERMLLEEVVGDDETPTDNLLVISDALRNELENFYRPYNERLFQLIGKRCPWKY